MKTMLRLSLAFSLCAVACAAPVSEPAREDGPSAGKADGNGCSVLDGLLGRACQGAPSGCTVVDGLFGRRCGAAAARRERDSSDRCTVTDGLLGRRCGDGGETIHSISLAEVRTGEFDDTWTVWAFSIEKDTDISIFAQLLPDCWVADGPCRAPNDQIGIEVVRYDEDDPAVIEPSHSEAATDGSVFDAHLEVDVDGDGVPTETVFYVVLSVSPETRDDGSPYELALRDFTGE